MLISDLGRGWAPTGGAIQGDMTEKWAVAKQAHSEVKLDKGAWHGLWKNGQCGPCQRQQLFWGLANGWQAIRGLSDVTF